MGKIDIKFSSKCSERTVGCIKEGICGAVIRRSEPFALEDSPEGLSNIQMRTVWRQEKEKQATLFPYRTKFLHELTSMDTRIVKYDKRVLADTERKPVKEVGDLVSGHVFGCRESFIPIVAIYHAENVESPSPFRMGYRHPHRGIAIRMAHIPRCRCGFHLHNRGR